VRVTDSIGSLLPIEKGMDFGLLLLHLVRWKSVINHLDKSMSSHNGLSSYHNNVEMVHEDRMVCTYLKF
jgi:hypothetical protein